MNNACVSREVNTESAVQLFRSLCVCRRHRRGVGCGAEPQLRVMWQWHRFLDRSRLRSSAGCLLFAHTDCVGGIWRDTLYCFKWKNIRKIYILLDDYWVVEFPPQLNRSVGRIPTVGIVYDVDSA